MLIFKNQYPTHNHYHNSCKTRKQIGMAVPRQGAKLIFEALLMILAGINYPFIPASVNGEKHTRVQMELFSEAQA